MRLWRRLTTIYRTTEPEGAKTMIVMKTYDFDKIIDRRDTGAIKTDALKTVFGKEDLIPMWVADMDFETPDFIVDSMKKRMEHPVFGYTAEPEDFRESIIDWIAGHHGWKVEKEWLSYIPGIVCSYAIVPDQTLRERFYGWLEANEFGAAPIFSPIATIAAFRHGEQWRRQMLEYIEGNIEYVISFCKERLPQIKPLRPQASFLVWLDCRGLGLGHDQLISLFIDKAGLALNDGEMFNPGGNGFMRLNVGTSRKVLQEVMLRLENALV